MVGAKLTAPGAPICAGPRRLAHSRHEAGAGADRRCQSTPATSHCHCSSLSSHTASPACGQTKWPRCKRRSIDLGNAHSDHPIRISPCLFRQTPTGRNRSARRRRRPCKSQCTARRTDTREHRRTARLAARRLLFVLAKCVIALDVAVHQLDRAIALLRQARIVSDQQNGAAKLLVEFAEQLKNFGGGLGVQVACGFVG